MKKRQDRKLVAKSDILMVLVGDPNIVLQTPITTIEVNA